MTKERIETIRQSLIPFVKKELLEINYDGLGKSDATEFEEDLNEILDLSVKALDCVSMGVYKQVAWERDAAIEQLNELGYSFGEKIRTSDDCVNKAEVRQFVEYIQSIKDSHNAKGTPINYGTICDLVIRGWKLIDLPSVTPTRNKPKEDITEDEVRINMLELALNQAKEHAESITVLTDDYRLIFKAEKRGSENE